MATKPSRIDLDLSDYKEILELLQAHAAHSGKTQKEIIVEALKEYFAGKRDTESLGKVAEKTFADWDNDEDEIYNSI